MYVATPKQEQEAKRSRNGSEKTLVPQDEFKRQEHFSGAIREVWEMEVAVERILTVLLGCMLIF